jgi:hypothetical protein
MYAANGETEPSSFSASRATPSRAFHMLRGMTARSDVKPAASSGQSLAEIESTPSCIERGRVTSTAPLGTHEESTKPRDESAQPAETLSDSETNAPLERAQSNRVSGRDNRGDESARTLLTMASMGEISPHRQREGL